MAKYDYECENCGVIELEHKMDEEIKECPKCEGKVLKKVGLSAVIFKGEGWSPKYHQQ